MHKAVYKKEDFKRVDRRRSFSIKSLKFLSGNSAIEFANEIHVRHKEIMSNYLCIISLCRVSLHDNMEFNAAFVFFKSFSAKHGKKGKEKRNDYSVIEQNALKRQLYGKYFKRFPSNNDRQDESLTGQVHDQAGHCPLTGRYFEPCCASPIINRIFIMPGFTLNLPEKSSLPKFCHAQQHPNIL